jgi:DNA polymerase-1
MTDSNLLLLVDGHSLAFRAYYALSKSTKGPLRTSTGIPTSICFGFLNSLIQVIETQKPSYIALAFDRPEPSFRHQQDSQYKANRAETPEDFFPDIRNLQDILAALNLSIVTSVGYEADDVIATLAIQAREQGLAVRILTGDRDLFQLVDESGQIKVLYLDKNSYTEFDWAAVSAKMGVKPPQIVDYKALSGDQSDNIPGVQGIGEKTAVKLLQEYPTLTQIYANLAQLKGAVKTRLEIGKEAADKSYFLAKLALDAPVTWQKDNFRLRGFSSKNLKTLLEKLELKTFLKKIAQLQEQLGGVVESDSTGEQLSLFEQARDNTVTIHPEIIDTPEKLTQLITTLKQYIDAHLPVAWDTETTSLDPRQATLVGIGCCWGKQPTDIAYIPLYHTQGKTLEREATLEALRPILEDPTYKKALQNAKFDRRVLKHQGIELQGVVFDTMLASYVLHPELTHNLNDLCDRYLKNITSLSYKDLNIPKDKTIANLDINTVANYCGMDAYATFNLVAILQAELTKIPPLEKLFLEVEQPLEIVLATMEETGILLDIPYLKILSEQLEKDLQNLEIQAYQAAGEHFNLGSPKQLSEILFERLGLNKKKSRKIKTGYSTDHATLEKLQGDHPIIDYILEHRTLAKLKSTYVDALPTLVDPQTKRIHTDFNQAVTATGRLSSSNPNLQNIPIRSQFSRQIRQAFLPQANWLLLAADYSQIELRILAHLSNEPVLIKAYQNQEDVHRVTAQLLFEKEEITPQERNLGKTINFGVIYGMGAQKFSRESGFSVEESRKFIYKYHRQYARVFEYLETMKREAIAQGYVTTILGRRRYFNFVSESLQALRHQPVDSIDLNSLKMSFEDAQLLRGAANAPIQGSSADIIKVAMVKIQTILPAYQAKLLLQVHDELVFEVPPEEKNALEQEIKTTMENAVSLTIPLLVEVRTGTNWMEAK